LADNKFHINNYNDDFLIIRSEDLSALKALGKVLYSENHDFIEEVIVAEREVLVKLNGPVDDAVMAELMNFQAVATDRMKSYRLPVYFNQSEDWSQVESHSGLKRKDVISKIIANNYTMAMFGFLPGFVYLDELDPSIQIPRKTIPSKYVKANSIAIGGKYLGVYAIDSPGGWHVIGETPISLLDRSSLPPVVINPGDEIQLELIDKNQFDTIKSEKVTFKAYND